MASYHFSQTAFYRVMHKPPKQRRGSQVGARIEIQQEPIIKIDIECQPNQQQKITLRKEYFKTKYYECFECSSKSNEIRDIATLSNDNA